MVGDLEPDSYSLSLSSIDGIKDPPNIELFTAGSIRGTITVTLHVNQPLPRRRLWNYRVLALGCNEHPLTNLLELSKYNIAYRL